MHSTVESFPKLLDVLRHVAYMIRVPKVEPVFLSRGIRLAMISALVISLGACAPTKTVKVETAPLPAPAPLPPPGYPEEKIERNRFSVSGEESVVGRLAAVRLDKGDTLADIARHFSLGISGISAANPGVDVWAPEAGKLVILPLRFTLPDAPRKGIVINLAAMRLFHYKKKGKTVIVTTYPVGIGAEDRPTPMGPTFVKRKVTNPVWYVPTSIAERYRKKGDPLPSEVPPGPLNPLGDRALYLNKPSYLIHGTNKPASIGLNATNGCLRMYPEDVRRLYDDTPVNTPVNIIHQPYLIGRSGNTVYLEIHASLFEDSETALLDKLFSKLRLMARKSKRQIDWEKVKKIVAEARGIPVPIFELKEGSAVKPEEIVEVSHPVKLYGRPEIPELTVEAWYVMAGDLANDTDAARLAAIINHQGPPIPARVMPIGGSYRVIAGPFKDKNGAGVAMKRLKIDLEIDGILVEPDRKK